MEECDDLVAEVEELLGLVVKELPVLLQRSQVLAETCDAEYRFAAKGGEMRMPLDIGVALREHRFNVAAVSSVVHPLGDGNVVRRHPSSISLRARSRSPWRLPRESMYAKARSGSFARSFALSRAIRSLSAGPAAAPHRQAEIAAPWTVRERVGQPQAPANGKETCEPQVRPQRSSVAASNVSAGRRTADEAPSHLATCLTS